MKKVKNVTKNDSIDLSKYHNSETGELLSSEMVGEKKIIEVKEETGMFTIKSKDYSVIDSKVLMKLIEVLNNADLGQVTKMFPLTKTESNILYNHTYPHTNATLQEYLEVASQSKFSNLMKRLIKAGVLYQIKGNIHGSVRTIYILNPFLCNKRKTFNAELLSYFKDFK